MKLFESTLNYVYVITQLSLFTFTIITIVQNY